MKKTVIFCSLLLLAAPAAFAQGAGRLLWKKAGAANAVKTEAGKKALSAARTTVKTAVLRARQARRAAYSAAGVRSKLPHALVQVIWENDGEHLSSGGFILEEFETGRRTLWAVVPYHVSGGEGEEILLRMVDLSGRVIKRALNVTVSGGYGKNAIDAALVRLPDNLAGRVFALRLSRLAARPGEELTACGFLNEKGVSAPPLFSVRRVTEAEGFKITADYRLPEDPGGYCGAPVLNASGYVLGAHCASRRGEKTFAVSADGIRQLLRAYYEGKAEFPVKVKGREVFKILSSQSIGSVALERGGRVLQKIQLSAFEGPFSYERAEAVFAETGVLPGDKLLFQILEHRRVRKVIVYTVPEEK